MATGLSFSTFSGPTHLKTFEARSAKSSSFVKTPVLINQRKHIHQKTNNFSICAQYNDQRGGGGGEFIAGFVLGGAILGAFGYIFAPQIRRTILDENEKGSKVARRPRYYEDGYTSYGFEKTPRDTLNEKISQLNSAIDNVSTRLRSDKKVPFENDNEDDDDDFKPEEWGIGC